MQADLAYVFKWSPESLDSMLVVDLMMWHAQIERIGRELVGKVGG